MGTAIRVWGVVSLATYVFQFQLGPCCWPGSVNLGLGSCVPRGFLGRILEASGALAVPMVWRGWSVSLGYGLMLVLGASTCFAAVLLNGELVSSFGGFHLCWLESWVPVQWSLKGCRY